MTYDDRRDHEHDDDDLPEGGAICVASLLAALLGAVLFGAWVYSHMSFGW